MSELQSPQIPNNVFEPSEPKGPINLDQIKKLSRPSKKEEERFVRPGSRILDVEIGAIDRAPYLKYGFDYSTPSSPVTAGYDEVLFPASNPNGVEINLRGVTVNIKGNLPDGRKVDGMQPLHVANIKLALKEENLFLIASDTTQETVSIPLLASKNNKQIIETLRALKTAEPQLLPLPQRNKILINALQVAREEALSHSFDIQEIMKKLSQGVAVKDLPLSF